MVFERGRLLRACCLSFGFDLVFCLTILNMIHIVFSNSGAILSSSLRSRGRVILYDQ